MSTKFTVEQKKDSLLESNLVTKNRGDPSDLNPYGEDSCQKMTPGHDVEVSENVSLSTERNHSSRVPGQTWS